MEDGTQMNLEMQVKYFEHWDERALFYLCKMFTSQLKKGDSYDQLQKCIHVSILDFIHFPYDNEYYRTIQFQDTQTNQLYSDKLEIQILELQKLPEEVPADDSLACWMKFFSGKNRKEFELMAKTNEYLDEAYNTLLKLSADETKRLEYEAREKALKDYNTQIRSAEKRGLQQGEQRTRQIFKLHLDGKTPEEIAAICNISTEKVLEILA